MSSTRKSSRSKKSKSSTSSFKNPSSSSTGSNSNSIPNPAIWAQQSFEKIFQGFPQTTSGFNINQTKDQINKLGLLKGYEDAARQSKDNVDAAIKSSHILAKAAEEMGKAIYGFTQASVEMGVQASQAMLAVKTLKDMVDVQSEYAKNSMDHLIAGTSKISDMAVKVANEAMEPISQRVNDTIEKISKAA